jgi:hypothetical protein
MENTARQLGAQLQANPPPLLHLSEYREDGLPQVSEKATNLQDAMLCLKTAIEQVQRFL